MSPNNLNLPLSVTVIVDGLSVTFCAMKLLKTKCVWIEFGMETYGHVYYQQTLYIIQYLRGT